MKMRRSFTSQANPVDAVFRMTAHMSELNFDDARHRSQPPHLVTLDAFSSSPVITTSTTCSSASCALLCNAVIQSGSQTIVATIAVSAGRNFVGHYAATTAGEARAALRLSSPLADCLSQVLWRGHVRRCAPERPQAHGYGNVRCCDACLSS